MGRRAGNGPKRHPESHFESFRGPGPEIAPRGLQKITLSHFGVKDRHPEGTEILGDFKFRGQVAEINLHTHTFDFSRKSVSDTPLMETG